MTFDEFWDKYHDKYFLGLYEGTKVYNTLDMMTAYNKEVVEPLCSLREAAEARVKELMTIRTNFGSQVKSQILGILQLFREEYILPEELDEICETVGNSDKAASYFTLKNALLDYRRKHAEEIRKMREGCTVEGTR